MIKLILTTLALAGYTLAPPEPHSLEVTSRVQGLMHFKDGTWQVYRRGETFEYEENGECTVAGRASNCMWFGFEFDFTAQTESTTLTCVVHLGTPTSIVTYRAEVAKDIQEGHFELQLSGRSGHVAHPGYVERDPEARRDQRMEGECSHAGTVVLRYAFTFHGV